jgi:ech hydrogenase subunit D
MFENQEIVGIEKAELLDRIRRISDGGFRLVQVSCTRAEMFQIDYSFDKNYRFMNLRVNIAVEDAQLPSISGIYPCAFGYENEIHDLFGVRIDKINIDYKGNFYRIAVKAPFNITGALPGQE